MQTPYKFTSTALEHMPYCEIYERCKEAFEGGEQLTREEKNRFFHLIQSNSGHHHFRLMGWCFPINQFMNKYIVKYKYDTKSWREYYAFDKTCLRKSYYTSSYILKIKEID